MHIHKAIKALKIKEVLQIQMSHRILSVRFRKRERERGMRERECVSQDKRLNILLHSTSVLLFQ